MAMENVLAIVCFTIGLVCYIGYRYCCENVYLKYNEQLVELNNKKEVRK